ncbi:hypothetical protein Tco_1163050 [Tanacetum coccineum]
MSSETKLTKYKDSESVDNTKYRGMIDRKSTSGLHLHGMLLNIMILQETNRTSYLHHRSRICIRRQGVPTSTVDEITSRILQTSNSMTFPYFVVTKESSTLIYLLAFSSQPHLIFKIPKIPSETSSSKTQRRTARISVRPCCLINLTSSNESSPLRNFSSPSDYNVAPPSTPLESPPKTPLAPQATSPIKPLTTPKFTPPPSAPI